MISVKQYDENQIIKAIDLLKPDNELFEIRVIGNVTNSGYFKDAEAAIKALSKLDLLGRNVYITLNEVNPACFSRSQSNCFISKPKITTSDNDITRLKWLFIDLDPKRISGTSSSEAELSEAHALARKIYEYLRECGFPEPIKALSGNGDHMLYSIDLENTKENSNLVKRCLQALDQMFSNEKVAVDTTTYNPSRISKLYGTIARKGAHTDERPHRMSRIISNPTKPEPVPRELLEQLADNVSPAAASTQKSKEPTKQHAAAIPQQFGFDIEGWMQKYGIQHHGAVAYEGGVKYQLNECPFDHSHKYPDSVIYKNRDGVLSFKCSHNSCSGKGWKDLRILFEPDAYSRKEPEKKEPAEAAAPAAGIKLNSLEEAEEKPVDWLIPEFIPRGSITLLAGDGGSGKTTCWCALAAAISRGEDPEFLKILRNEYDPGPNPFDSSVWFFTAEDDVERVLLKRLKKAGADTSKIKYLSAADEAFPQIKFNSNELAWLIEEHRPTLCIFDPVQSFIPPDMHMGERNAMRQVLTPLMGFGEKYGTSFLLVAHTNKRQGAWGRNRIADSADLWDACRSVIIVGQVPGEQTRYFSQEKCNYAPRAQTRLFTINSVNGQAEFHSFSQKYDQDFVKASDLTRGSPDRDEAKNFILEYLTEHSDEEITVKNLMENAKSYGISDSTLRRAKEELTKSKKIRIKQRGKKGQRGTDWYVTLL